MKRQRTGIGKRIQRVMWDRDLTYAKLSDITDCDVSLLFKYVNGEYEPTGANIVKICKGLGVSADYLLGLKETEQ